MHIKNLNFAENKNGLLLVLFTALISGFSIFISSFGVKEFDSSVFTFLKNAAVALLLLGIIVGFRQFNEIKALNKKQWLQLILIGFVGGSIPFLLFFKGLQMTTGATAAFLHKTIFIYVAVFAIIFLKEKLTKGLFFGSLMILAGNYLMIKPDFRFSAGNLLIFIAVAFWAAENVFAKHVLKELSGNVVAFGRMFFGSVFILIFLLVSGKLPLLADLTGRHLMWILISDVFLLLYVLTYYNGLKQIKATTAACILTLGLPITTLLDYAFRGVNVSVMQATGMALILAGIISIAWLNEALSAAKTQVKHYGWN